MSTTYKLVFQGDLASGYTATAAAQALANLYRVPVNQVQHFFSGAEFVLKEGVGELEVDQYLAAYAQAGIVVVKIPEMRFETATFEPLLQTSQQPAQATMAQTEQIAMASSYEELAFVRTEPEHSATITPLGTVAHDQFDDTECIIIDEIQDSKKSRSARPLAYNAKTNVYAPPQAQLLSEDDLADAEDYCDPKLFSFEERLGRIRYLAWSILPVIVPLVLGIIAALFPFLTLLASIPIGIATLVFVVSLTIRRLHDLNYNGWHAIPVYLAYIASVLSTSTLSVVVNLAITIGLACIPGAAQSNNFGPRCKPPVTWEIVLAAISIVLMVISIATTVFFTVNTPNNVFGEGNESYSQYLNEMQNQPDEVKAQLEQQQAQLEAKFKEIEEDSSLTDIQKAQKAISVGMEAAQQAIEAQQLIEAQKAAESAQ